MRRRDTVFVLFCGFFLLPLFLSGEILSLEECLEMAFKNNYGLRMSVENVSLSRSQNQMSYSEMLPYVSAQSSVSRSPTSYGVEPYSDIYSTSVSVTQTVFDISTVFDIQSSRAKLKESVVLYEAAVREVELSVAGTFFDLLKKKRLLFVRELGYRESEENLRKTELMYEIGTVSKIDLLRSEVVKNQSELDLLRAERELELSRANLAYAIGFSREGELDVREDSFEIQEYLVSDYDSLLEKVITHNAEIEAQRQAVSSGKAQLASSFCRYLPKLTVSGSYGYSGDKFTTSRDEWDAHDSWSIGASVSLPLFTGFSRSAGIRQSKAALRLEEIGLDDIVTQKGIELKKALLSLNEARKTHILAEKNFEKAELSYRMVQEKYNLGAATIIELIDAEQDFEEAQVTEISSYFDLLLSSFYITNLLGERIVGEERIE
jgi:outer membrane protein TolC